MVGYHRRLIDQTLDELFPELTAIALEGAKGVGKTATASQRATTTYSLHVPSQRRIIDADPEIVNDGPFPVFVDEWQLEPPVWDVVRKAVDDDPSGGRFLLAGSADVLPGARIHSGAGRIISLVMRPLSFFERGVVEPAVSLADLLAGGRKSFRGSTDFRLTDYVDEIIRSGFPGIRDFSSRVRKAHITSYIDRAIQKELPDSGVEVRRPDSLRLWLTAYGAATGTDASYEKILNAATPHQKEKPARATVTAYREHLSRIFLLDPLPAWTPTFAPLQRLTKSPKHHLVDPALAASLAKLDKPGLIQGATGAVAPLTGHWLGSLFESLVVQSVRVYAEASDARVFHLRTQKTEHEVDLIIETDNLSVVPIEVKLNGAIDDDDVKHLNWLEQQLGDRVRDKVVINTGPFAYRRRDGVAVVPLALLGP